MPHDVPLLEAVGRALYEGSGARGSPPPVVVLDEFLSQPDLRRLVEWTLARRERFVASQVIRPDGVEGMIQQQTRRSQVLFETAPWQRVFAHQLESVFEHVIARLGMEPFEVHRVETQITASNDGEFFRMHNDNAHPALAPRRLTYVYFFCREPAPFVGGRLRIFETRTVTDGHREPGPQEVSITPQQNQIVFFPSSQLHEVEEVRCPTRAFADSRFTVNGWLHAG